VANEVGGFEIVSNWKNRAAIIPTKDMGSKNSQIKEKGALDFTMQFFHSNGTKYRGDMFLADILDFSVGQKKRKDPTVSLGSIF